MKEVKMQDVLSLKKEFTTEFKIENRENLEIATVLFCYDRPHYLKKTLNSFKEKIDFAFIDHSHKQDMIYEMLKNKVKFIYKRTSHLGLAENVISGFNKVYSLGYDATIFLVDDILIEGDFFNVMRMNLIKYKDNKNVGSISTHYLSSENKRFIDWGFGTWKDRWEKVDWNFKNKIDMEFGKVGSDLPKMYERARESKLDSWAVRFAYHCYENNLICVHPVKKKMLKHIGRQGTHYNLLSAFSLRKYIRKIISFFDKTFNTESDVWEDVQHSKSVRKIYKALSENL